MKEATGELNNTVIVVLSIGILIAFFYYVIWPMLDGNLEHNSSCDHAVCDSCNDKINGCKTVKCKTENGTQIECVYKG